MAKKEKDLNPEMGNTNGAETGFDLNTDENMGGSTHLNDPLTEDSAIDELQAELDEQKDKYLRLAADFDNFKRRNAKERLELIQTAGKDIIYELLDVLDDMDRARQQLETSGKDTMPAEGVTLIFNKLKNVLQSRGLKEMNAKGSDFDPDKHEAIAEVPVPGGDAAGKIIDEVVKGYLLNDKLIRHAKVVTGK